MSESVTLLKDLLNVLNNLPDDTLAYITFEVNRLEDRLFRINNNHKAEYKGTYNYYNISNIPYRIGN